MQKLWATITHITHPDYALLGLQVCDQLTERTGVLYINRMICMRSWTDLLSPSLESKDSSIVLLTPYLSGNSEYDTTKLPDLALKHLMLRCTVFSKRVVCVVDPVFHPSFRSTMSERGAVIVDDHQVPSRIAEDLADAIIDMHPGGSLWRFRHG